MYIFPTILLKNVIIFSRTCAAQTLRQSWSGGQADHKCGWLFCEYTEKGPWPAAWQPLHKCPLSCSRPCVRLGSRTVFMKTFWIDFLSICGYKEAPGDQLLDVNPSHLDKTVNSTSPISNSKFLIVVNHLLTQDGNDHTAGHTWCQTDQRGIWVLPSSLDLFAVKVWSSYLLL